jgi:diguanylate cyclase (GGDEF)-like protein
MLKKKILIIDGTEQTVGSIFDVLIPSGYDVIIASSGEEGLEKVKIEKPDLVILDSVLPGVDGFEVCKTLRNEESNNLMPIIILTDQKNEEGKLKGLELGADDYIEVPFNSRELLARVKNTLIRIERNRRVSPLTGLQGNMEVQTEISRRIANNQIFSLIYADIDNFKAYNDLYGFSSGDRTIKLTADIIIDSVSKFGDSCDFVGHVGGDDFIIITAPNNAEAVCDDIVRVFNEKILTLYSPEDRGRGFITTSNRQGHSIKHPIMGISLAIVSNEFRNLTSHMDFMEVAVELKKKAKTIAGSVYFKDRRRS